MAEKLTEKNIEDALNSLENMPIEELKALCGELFGEHACSSVQRELMTRKIAYKWQEQVYGALSQGVKNKLHRLAFKNQKAMQNMYKPKPGMRLVREWKNQQIVVNVLDKGFEYHGKIYKTLTAIAVAITNTQTSGPLFFGFKRRKYGKQEN